MGKRKTRTTQTNRPIYESQITGAATGVQDAYNQAQPMISAVSNNAGTYSGDIFAGIRSDGNAVNSANRFLVGQLEGDPAQNPYLDQIVNQTNNNVRNQLQARLARAGASGGSDYTNLISRALAENEGGLRYADFNNAMNRRFQAAGMSPLAGNTALQAGQAGAMLPLQAGALNAASIGGLLGQYQNTQSRTVQSGGLLGQILSAAAQAGMTAAMCDIRVKENIERIGETPAGLPLYMFDYIGGPKGVIGPIAQEVAIMQPEALGPVIDGYMTVIPARLQ